MVSTVVGPVDPKMGSRVHDFRLFRVHHERSHLGLPGKSVGNRHPLLIAVGPPIKPTFADIVRFAGETHVNTRPVIVDCHIVSSHRDARIMGRPAGAVKTAIAPFV